MSRPRSADRRNAILSAATRAIAVQGLGAATAAIAKEAGVSNGSLFVYFDTKATLLNELYVALKSEMGAAAVDGLPVESDTREQVHHMWNQWLRWATSFPEKRRALAQLEVSDDITAESHRIVSSAFSAIADLMERSRVNGPVREAPPGFVLALTSAVADATSDEMIREPDRAEIYARIAFDAVWRMLACPSTPATD
jgi:AcrR family transcriptional regulator